jgi:hypothetical protein
MTKGNEPVVRAAIARTANPLVASASEDAYGATRHTVQRRSP